MNVFISHAEADSDFAQELAQGLERQGCSVWHARKDIFPGDNIWLKVGEALNRANAMVVVLTPASVRADNVSQEIGFALGSARFRDRLIPVLLDNPSDVPWILHNFHMIKAERREADRAARSLAVQLRKGTRKAAS